MPQMKPMNWILLFFFTNMILILMNIMNYTYYKIYNKNMKNNFFSKKNINWKW